MDKWKNGQTHAHSHRFDQKDSARHCPLWGRCSKRGNREFIVKDRKGSKTVGERERNCAAAPKQESTPFTPRLTRVMTHTCTRSPIYSRAVFFFYNIHSPKPHSQAQKMGEKEAMREREVNGPSNADSPAEVRICHGSHCGLALG